MRRLLGVAMNPRYATPDRGPICETRRQLGWTQRQVATKSGVSLRTLQSIEQGKRAELSSIAAVEGALGIRSPNWALHYLASLSPEKAHLLRSRTGEYWPADADPYHHFVRALHRDAEGKAGLALKLCRLILDEEDSHTDEAFRCGVLLHMACIYDHLNDPCNAIDASERALAAAVGLGAESKLRWWSLYQKAIARIRLEQYDAAEEELLGLANHAGGDRSRQAAALHQLGVVQMQRRRYGVAIDYFVRCTKLRRPGSVRLCYEYRRLGQGYAELGDVAMSQRFYRAAFEAAVRHNFGRYLEIIRSEAAHYQIELLRICPS